MDPEDRDLLERTFKLARDNNRLLQSMSRAALFSGLFRVLAWLVVLGGSIWLYLNYLNPLLDSATHTLNQAQGVSDSASANIGTIRAFLASIQHALASFSGSTTTPQQ